MRVVKTTLVFADALITAVFMTGIAASALRKASNLLIEQRIRTAGSIAEADFPTVESSSR